MADRAEKRQEGDTKSLISWEQKEIFTRNKNHFSSFFKGWKKREGEKYAGHYLLGNIYKERTIF